MTQPETTPQDEFWTNLWFIRLAEDSKHPIEQWGGYDQDYELAENVYSWDELAPNYRYGYFGHQHPDYTLGVIDYDFYKTDSTESDIRPPYDVCRIESPSGGLHIPFLMKGNSIWELNDEYGDWVDLKGEINKGHVVFPNNTEYERKNGPIPIVDDDTPETYFGVMDDNPIMHKLSEEEKAQRIIDKRVKEIYGYQDWENGNIYQVLQKDAFPPGHRTIHPYHSSSSGENFMVDEDGKTFRCWRHECTGNITHLLGMDLGMIECGEWESFTYADKQAFHKKMKAKANDLDITLFKDKGNPGVPSIPLFGFDENHVAKTE